jgi:hypothetical protein
MSYVFKWWLPSSHHLGYMEATENLKYPYKPTRDTCPWRANSDIFVFAALDGCPATANLVSLDASLAIPTRVLRFEVSGLRHRTPVRPVLLTGQTGTYWSDRSGVVATLSLVLPSWLWGSTEEPSGFLVNHRKPRELGVAFAKRQSWLGSYVVPTRPWFWGSTKKPSMTSSCRSCHHAARTWPCWPPGPSNQAYLSSPHLEASPATTFHACSSPAST